MYRTALFATVAALGLATLVLSLEMLPLHYGDAEYFMAPVVNYAAGKGLVNPWYVLRDPQGGRMVWHGYLMPQLYGTLLWKASYPALVLLQGFVAILVLSVSALLFYAVSARPGRVTPTALAATGILMLIGLLPPLLGGRPEPLATLLLVSVVLVLMRTPLRHQWWIIAAALSLAAAITPAAGVISALVAAVYYYWVFPPRQARWTLLATGILAAAGLAAVTAAVCPFGLVEWLKGILRHFSQLDFEYQPLLRIWFFQSHMFAYGIWLLAALVAAGILAREKLRSAAIPAGLVVFGLLLLAVCWRLGIWTAGRNYNLLTFAPLACALVLKAFWQIGPLSLWERVRVRAELGHATASTAQPSPPAPLPTSLRPVPGEGKPSDRWRKAMLCWLLAVVLGVPALSTAKMLLCTLVPQPGRLSYAEAKRLVDELRRSQPKIALSSGLFVLAEKQEGVEIADLNFGTATVEAVAAPILVLQQAKFVWPDSPAAAAGYPPDIPGFQLIDDHFTHCHPAVLGLRLAYTPESYNLAVYRRVEGGRPGSASGKSGNHP
jgi:hypothetical protein